jgi:hypothetical protein
LYTESSAGIPASTCTRERSNSYPKLTAPNHEGNYSYALNLFFFWVMGTGLHLFHGKVSCASVRYVCFYICSKLCTKYLCMKSSSIWHCGWAYSSYRKRVHCKYSREPEDMLMFFQRVTRILGIPAA